MLPRAYLRTTPVRYLRWRTHKSRLSPSEAFDAAAETFTVAWRRHEQIPDGDRALLWLYGVAHRVVSNQWRSRRRQSRLKGKIAGLGAARAPGPEQQTLNSDEQREVLEARRSLSRRDQEILVLAACEDLKPEEIAQVLGITRAAVDQRFSRARGRLARELAATEMKGSLNWGGQLDA